MKVMGSKLLLIVVPSLIMIVVGVSRLSDEFAVWMVGWVLRVWDLA